MLSMWEKLLRYRSQLKRNGKDVEPVCRKCLSKYLKNIPAENAAHWINEKTKDRWGHILIHKSLVPEKYHYLVCKKNYLFEHRFIMAKKISRKLKQEEIVHHINGAPDDNRPENLVIVDKNNHERYTLLKLAQKRIKELEKEACMK